MCYDKRERTTIGGKLVTPIWETYVIHPLFVNNTSPISYPLQIYQYKRVSVFQSRYQKLRIRQVSKGERNIYLRDDKTNE